MIIENHKPKPSMRTPPSVNDGHDRLEDLFSKKREIDFSEGTGFRSGPSSKRKSYTLVLWSFLASFIDLLVLTSLSSMFILSFSLIVKTEFGSVINELLNQPQFISGSIIVFLLTTWLYLNILRLVMGSTLGEWTCGLSLGYPAQKNSSDYWWRLLLRSSILVLSGIVICPVLSILFGKDLIGELTGVKLVSF